MKKFLQSVISRAVAHDALWRPFNALAGIANFATRQRALVLFGKNFPDDRVRSGFFAGMRIPNGGYAKGSILIPKFIGTYEAELTPVVEECVRRQPPLIIDVGCAEGFYAVGLAMRCPEAKVIAFDTIEQARKACEDTASANGVSDRISVQGECHPADLLAMKLPAGSLVMSDCEGYELELFTDEVARHLAACLVLIEVHDCYRPETSATLKRRFAASHDLQVIRSSRDKSDYHAALSDSGFTPQMKEMLSHEREFNMDWFFLTPKPAVDRA